MKLQKSSKKISVIVVILVLLTGITIGGYLVLKSGVGVASISQRLNDILEENKKTISGCQSNPNDKNKDSDYDGLMDWQEVTWKTNPCVQDTDGDGYLDGEEVTAGYDPTKPAPNDKLADQESTEPRPLPNNLTQALAQSLAKKIAEENPASITGVLDSDSINTSNQIVDQAIQETLNKAILEFSLPKITNQEIFILSDNSPSAIQTYAGEIVETIEQWAVNTSVDRIEKSESELFYQAIQTKNFVEIDQYIEFYKGTAQSIKQIPVPSDLINIHKEQIGVFWVIGNIYQAIKEIDTDPLKTNLALEQYKITRELFNQTLIKLANYIETHP